MNEGGRAAQQNGRGRCLSRNRKQRRAARRRQPGGRKTERHRRCRGPPHLASTRRQPTSRIPQVSSSVECQILGDLRAGDARGMLVAAGDAISGARSAERGARWQSSPLRVGIVRMITTYVRYHIVYYSNFGFQTWAAGEPDGVTRPAGAAADSTTTLYTV